MFQVLCFACAFVTAVGAVSFTVESSSGNATSPYQYGIMFEDINHSGDGGVYAELIQNRAFQGSSIFPSTLASWSPIGDVELSLHNSSKPLSSSLPTSMRVTASNRKSGTVGFWNTGFWGFPVLAKWQYDGSFYIKGHFAGNITISFKSNTTSDILAATSVDASSSSSHGWTKFAYLLQPTSDAPDSNNTLQFTVSSSDIKGPLDFNLLSLFPPTFKDRPNGLRVDLMEAMAGLKPSFFRAPGGNNLEGNAPPYWWNWTHTLGPLEDRLGFPGTWGYENTNGLGLVEYMLWAQDLGMEPVLAVWAGLWLDGTSVPQAELQPYVQSALDELEFLMGDISTKWGSYRAKLGYPEPWRIKFVEVGNEDSLSNGKESYGAYRFRMFYEAINAAYPDITIIASYYDVGPVTPPFNASGDFHEYAVPSQMANQFDYFDNYTSEHPILIGEYAILEYDHQGLDAPQFNSGALRALFPFWYGTVAEAIFLLGAERNSDKIIGASYAPGFMNLNSWAWIPDMIEYDANPSHTVLSTSYRMVQLLSGTRITENLPLRGATFGPAFFVAGRNDVTGSHVLKAAVYNSSSSLQFDVNFEGVGAGARASLKYLTAPVNASSTIGNDVVKTHSSTIWANRNGHFSFELPDYSIAVMEICADHAGSGHNYNSPGSRHGWKGWKQWGHGGGHDGWDQ